MSIHEARSIEVKGKTVDEAIFNGLDQLGLSIDQVNVEILHEGSKGIFGLGKSAQVRLTEKDSPAKDAENFLNTLFEKMHVGATGIYPGIPGYRELSEKAGRDAHPPGQPHCGKGGQNWAEGGYGTHESL